MSVTPFRQFLAVFEYELKQAFYSKKAIVTFLVISSFFFILLYWLFQLETSLLDRETMAQAKIAEKFREIVIDNFYSKFPFLNDCPFYIIILQFYFTIFIPILSFVLIADIASNELRDRTFRFFAYRINLVTVMLGKYVAYVVQFSILSALMWAIAIVCFESISLSYQQESQVLISIRYAFHFWFIDHAIWCAAIAISLLLSIIAKNPYIAAAGIDILLVFLLANKYTRDFMHDVFFGFIYPVSPELFFSVICYFVVAFCFMGSALLIMKKKEL